MAALTTNVFRNVPVVTKLAPAGGRIGGTYGSVGTRFVMALTATMHPRAQRYLTTGAIVSAPNSPQTTYPTVP